MRGLTILLVFALAILAACGGGSGESSLDKDFLLKNKFAGGANFLIFEDETKFKLTGAESACTWEYEGTYVIDGDKVVLTATKCNNSCIEDEDKCIYGSGTCTIVDVAGVKKLKFVNGKNVTDECFILDKANPCKQIKEEHASVGSGATELEGKWTSANDPNSVIEYGADSYTNIDSTGTPDGGGKYKISKQEMPAECFDDVSIKSLKKGKYLNKTNHLGMYSSLKYKVDGDVLIIYGSQNETKYNRVK